MFCYWNDFSLCFHHVQKPVVAFSQSEFHSVSFPVKQGLSEWIRDVSLFETAPVLTYSIIQWDDRTFFSPGESNSWNVSI